MEREKTANMIRYAIQDALDDLVLDDGSYAGEYVSRFDLDKLVISIEEQLPDENDDDEEEWQRLLDEFNVLTASSTLHINERELEKARRLQPRIQQVLYEMSALETDDE